jgi:hypothetical protein
LEETFTDSGEFQATTSYYKENRTKASRAETAIRKIGNLYSNERDTHEKGQLKYGNNVQMGTENQFVLFYTAQQRPTDTICFIISHLENIEATSLPMLITASADTDMGDMFMRLVV